MQKIIDPHIHFFHFSKGEYAWLKNNQPPFWPDKHKLARHFTERDITAPSSLCLAGYVHIEAGFDNNQPWLELTVNEDKATLPIRSIGFADITQSPEAFVEHINKLVVYRSFIGIRHILDENDLYILKHPNTLQNLTILARKQLIFELQINLSTTDAFSELRLILNTLPNLKVVLNHAGFVPMDNECEKTVWLERLTVLASYSQLFIKCSGWEMVSRKYSKHDMNKTLVTITTLFNEDNIMLASNFPLTLLSISYSDYWLQLIEVTKELQLNTDALCYYNASRFYNLAI